jgi:hypothetical protein
LFTGTKRLKNKEEESRQLSRMIKSYKRYREAKVVRALVVLWSTLFPKKIKKRLAETLFGAFYKLKTGNFLCFFLLNLYLK